MFVRQQLRQSPSASSRSRPRSGWRRCESELAQARTNLARRPAATSLVLPAQKITVESGIQREILRLMAIEGLGRVWRIVERVLADGLTGNANTVRNAVSKLDERELLADYDQHGKTCQLDLQGGRHATAGAAHPHGPAVVPGRFRPGAGRVGDRRGRAAAQVGEPRHRRAGDGLPSRLRPVTRSKPSRGPSWLPQTNPGAPEPSRTWRSP